ncbi:hypothetical protein [Stakelama tenebrarum]|uniref:Uncharacterized protein n=1 Tax=Stakelama tenebrarum TaxID=2711215 RepID=A0A6G6Y0C9_9SPHN|nr:hypothetical protein [Sphingosinithalassobacter tenebrarum]QIG78375.1 hypothetical protein G5C33_00230 [Sphingosinithalassobacter tenebrarum]
MADATPLAALALIAAGAGAALLLRRAWRHRGERRFVALGWAAIAVALIVPALFLGSARGPFIAETMISIGALIVVARGVTVREKRGNGRQSLAPEPSERPSAVWRGVLRWLLAGPVGMIAAMGVGIAYAVWVPGAPQTRLLVAGLMIPVLWGGAIAWTLADNRILRATAVLVGVSVVTFSAAVLKGFA